VYGGIIVGLVTVQLLQQKLLEARLDSGGSRGKKTR